MFINYINEITNYSRIVIIGDIHGDIKRFKEILIDSRVINENLEWIAEPADTIIVQLGDQIDSLNRSTNENWEVLNDYEMIYFTEHLNTIAKCKGGSCISLIGNHELMNVIGDFSYVSQMNKQEPQMRKKLFKPQGSIALILAKRPIVIKIGDLLFCHAKFQKEHLELLKKYKKDIYYLNYLWKRYLETGKVDVEDMEIFNNIILGYQGILWNRNMENPEFECEELFKELKITYMFIGHTAFERVTIYDNKIWYCDTGISRAFGKKEYQYIDIHEKTINIKTIQQ
jgi:hypothetical protein